MTREEIENTPEIVDFMLDKSVLADSRTKVRKRLEELCGLAIKALDQQPFDEYGNYKYPSDVELTETNNFIQDHLDQINEFVNQIRKYQEKELAWIITNYDFIVGSIECEHKLMEILPDDANIICSPYVEDPTMIYAVKKFDIKDLINLEDWIKFGDQDTLMPAT
jgi:hypothetical protein